MAPADSTAALDAVFRIEFPRIVAAVARSTGDVGLAEELAQDAVVEALQQWPAGGIPGNPGAWLTAVAKRRAIDRYRRDRTLGEKYSLIASSQSVKDNFEHIEDDIHDDQLRLIFAACHPVIPLTSRVALTLRVVGGLTTPEIARAFVQPETTIAQRIVRAKNAIRAAGAAFEIPEGAARAARLDSVLEVIYLIFNEGYSATAGGDWTRPELCADAVRLARQLASLARDDPEVHGLLALLEIQSSRLTARTGPNGEPILLLDQDRRRWDRLHINLGLSALARAEQLAPEPGPYTLQAAIAACHARSFRAEDTDWARVAALYGQLAHRAPSPVVELNRAVAVGMASGPAAGLALVDQLAATRTLERYHLLHSVRGDLLEKLGRSEEAADAFAGAATLTQNAQERELLRRREAALRGRSTATTHE